MNILYIATREASYSRISIIRTALAARFPVQTILSNRKSYPIRLLIVALRFMLARLTGKLRHVDAVFVGFLAQPLLPWIRLFWRGPLVADAYLSVYDTLVHDKQKVREGTILARIAYWLDRYMLRRADLCFADTQAHVHYFKHSFDVSRPVVRRLWVSSEYTRIEKPVTETPAQPFRVFFWGNFIPLQGVDTIVRAAGLLLNDDVQFTVVGRGQTYAMCARLQHELNAENISFVPWMTPHEISSYASQSHVILGVFGTTAKAGRVIPNKVYQALAMGRPLITGQSAAISELLEDHVDVLLTQRGSPEELAAKICWVKENLAEAERIARRGYDTFQRLASPERIQAILRRELNRLVPSGRPDAVEEPAMQWPRAAR